MESALAKTDYSFYLEYTHAGLYHHAAHTELICDELRAVERGDTERLMLFLPPRHSKSMTVTETFPSFFIGKSAERRVISVSYSGSLAKKFGRANKNKLVRYGGSLFGIQPARDNASVTDWGIEGHRGGMVSAGVGSSITGEGADLLLIDDPIKNRKEANSVAYREMLWNEWQNTLITRLQPGAPVIIIMTRWHEDDLAGRLLRDEPDKWRVINVPAEAEDDDLLGRERGEALWPAYGFDKEWLEERKASINPSAWNALYQQRPAPESGDVVKRYWWRFWCYPGDERNLQPVRFRLPEDMGGGYKEIHPDPLPSSLDQIVQSWDMTFTDVVGAHYVVGQVWAAKAANRYLLDQDRARRNFPSTLTAFRELTEKWPQATRKFVEAKANGPGVISSLSNEISGIIPVNPEGSKVARLYAVSSEIESGNIYLPHPDYYPWVWEFIEELSAFPNAENDDQVDTLTQALSGLRKAKFTFV